MIGLMRAGGPCVMFVVKGKFLSVLILVSLLAMSQGAAQAKRSAEDWQVLYQQVNYEINDNIEYSVVCAVCGNQTPICKNLLDAIRLWNQSYCCALPPHEIELA